MSATPLQLPLLFEPGEKERAALHLTDPQTFRPSNAAATAAATTTIQSQPSLTAECPVSSNKLEHLPEPLPPHADHTHRHNLINPSKRGDTPKCPVAHDSENLNPLNMMPALSQSMAPEQTKPLSTERELSSIPRTAPHSLPQPSSSSGPGAGETGNVEVWEYPSPQQFYNALARKGMPAHEDDIDIMVQIHNFLNEGAWQEVLKWEALHRDECPMPRLERLQGRPNDLSPKARFFSWIYGTKPFDRHDWYIDRCGKQVRYIIDYYEAEPEGDMPAFSLDIRPALDSVEALRSRVQMSIRELRQRLFGSGNNSSQ
ncbi:holocytochrome c synthase [Spiromyces aspiralis]|uniref:Holocytochrome c synthase n=1 Tax=Spiromyces aspiralis TaxID=68401 RepID=A0ACC1HWB1_9FUNG|nr:holocytochrome c synthase [Spiromyces aspiralis]